MWPDVTYTFNQFGISAGHGPRATAMPRRERRVRVQKELLQICGSHLEINLYLSLCNINISKLEKVDFSTISDDEMVDYLLNHRLLKLRRQHATG